MKILNFWRDERGAVSIIAAVSMVSFLGVTGLAVDVGHAWKVQAELQRAADAGAAAGVLAMFPGGTVKDCTAASSTGLDFTQRNKVDEQTSDAGQINVEVGQWVLPNGPFNTAACQPANAVRVSGTRQINLNFATVLGINTMTPKAQATAISKIAGSVPGNKAFPFCIDESRVPPIGSAQQIFINSQGSDYGCWTPFLDPNGKVKDYLDGTLQSPPLYYDQIINVKNGVDASDLTTIKNQYIGQTVTVLVIPNGEHSGTTKIKGFAKVKVIAVDPPALGTKGVIFETLSTSFTDPEIGGGGATNYNLSAAGSSLVQ